jgi:16S rRNA pseudouridine516 synthase
MAEQLRLGKYLADMGIGTRSEIKNYIRKGRVKLNREPCTKPEQKVMPGRIWLPLTMLRLGI